MTTREELVELACPAALLDAVAKFEALAVERIPADQLFVGSTHCDIVIELLDDTFTVLCEGSCFDRADVLLDDIRELTAAIFVERHPAAFRAYRREVAS